MIHSYFTDETIQDDILIKQILNSSDKKNLIGDIKRCVGGSKSYAFAVNDYVVRFPKAEIIWQTMQREKQILDAIYPFFPNKYISKIHKIELIDGNYPFSITKKFNGKICDNRENTCDVINIRTLSSQQYGALVQDIAEFLSLLHSIDYSKLEIPPTNETIDNWDVTKNDGFEYSKVRQALLKYSDNQLDLDEYKINNVNNTLALCHNDLSGSNLLLNLNKNDVLEGIIDFANAVIAPKYLDFIPLYKIKRRLVVDVLEKYNTITDDKIGQKQIDYTMLSYIGLGLSKTIEKPSLYFLKLLKWFLED